MTVLPLIEPFPAHLEQRGGSGDLLAAEIMHQIERTIGDHPRSLQKRIGPSEVGHPCKRRVGYKLLDVAECNTAGDTPWLPTIGTAVHSWLEEVFTFANPGGNEPTRWLTELRVNVGEVNGVDITGSADLYDRVTATVIDWKIVGPTQLKKYKANGPGDQYRSQIHLYGRGMTRRGLPVDRVMIAFLPRNGELRDAYLWHEGYDEQVALAALERLAGIHLATSLAGVSVLSQLDPVESYCTRCPWFRPGSSDVTTGCPGVPNSRQNPVIDPTAPAFGPITQEKSA